MAIHIQRAKLANGLRVLVHEDHTTPLAAVNIVYKVGSRDENPEHTGIAHLMEHFMFCGSAHIPNYDSMLQKVGAINNAYTSQDVTHYYILLPANNLETALWLESDRMLALAFQQKSLDVQKNVVIEEFKESYLNRPYGDLTMLFNALVYEKHPYQWLPIGKKTEQIGAVTMPLIKDFYDRFYNPVNAVLAIAGNVHYEEVLPIVDKWFGDIPSGNWVERHYAQELPQLAPKMLTVHRNVPSDMLLKGWLMCNRIHPDYYAFDLLSDLLGTGKSSYLYRKFVVEKPIFTDIFASVSGTIDDGVFMVGGRPAEGISIEEADALLSDYLYQHPFDEEHIAHDIRKVQNRAESILLNNVIKIEDRATMLALGETISNAEYFINECDHYFAVTEEQLKRIMLEYITAARCKTLYYKAHASSSENCNNL